MDKQLSVTASKAQAGLTPASRFPSMLAAIDIGSNSFRLEIGRYDSGHIERVEYLKETVRQGSGLDENKNLSLVAMERGWECLARFAERLHGFRKQQVRAVATQTLREARNRDEFLRRAQPVLGFPIEVISGREEARLIYAGVAHINNRNAARFTLNGSAVAGTPRMNV